MNNESNKINNFEALREAIEDKINKNINLNNEEEIFKERFNKIKEKIIILEKILEKDCDPDVGAEVNQLKLEYSYIQTRIREVQLRNDLITNDMVQMSKISKTSESSKLSMDPFVLNKTREFKNCKQDLILKANAMHGISLQVMDKDKDLSSRNITTGRPRSRTFIEAELELPEQTKGGQNNLSPHI